MNIGREFTAWYTRQMFEKFKIPLISLTLLFAAILAAFLLQQTEPEPFEFESNMGVPVMSPAIALPAVTLIDQHKQAFPMSDLKGNWSLMFFGFTNCPDVCPTTLMAMKQVEKRLSQQNIRYVFVSLDPKRDSSEKLKDYMDFFNPEFIALNGDKSEIDKLSQAMGVIYDFDGDTSGDDYFVNHYAAILVIDPQVRLRAHILPPHSVDKVADAITKLSNYYGN